MSQLCLSGIVLLDLDSIWVGKCYTSTPTFRSLKVNNDKEVLVKNVCVFALQDQYPAVSHGKKYLCSGGICEVSLFCPDGHASNVLIDHVYLISLLYISYRLCSVLLNYIVHILCFVRLYRLCFNIPPNCGRSYH